LTFRERERVINKIQTKNILFIIFFMADMVEYMKQVWEKFPEGDSQKTTEELVFEIQEMVDAGGKTFDIKWESALNACNAQLIVMEENPGVLLSKDNDTDLLYITRKLKFDF